MTQGVITLLSVLALVADALIVAALAGLVLSRLSPRLRGRWDGAREAITPYALPGAFVVSVIAVSGSLFFQYGAQFTPCTDCWFQRICMYPQVLLLGVAAFRSDLFTARLYAAPLAFIGSGVSVYQLMLQHFFPEPAGGCGIGVPVCSGSYINEFGFITIPFLALSGFWLILTLLFTARDDEPAAETDDDIDEPMAVADRAETRAAVS
jgi:disulfide bond formation protein DsbB